jgi:lantibiotic biosynthesis protein
VSWTPLLGPSERERALTVVRAIASALRAGFAVPADVPSTEAWALADGRSGVALFFAYLGRACGDDHAQAFAARLVEQSLEAATGQAVLHHLYQGFAGVAWTLAHVDGWLFELSDGDPNDGVDAALLDLVRDAPWRGEYDLVSGLTGIGLYALERLPRPTAHTLLSTVVARLAELAEADAEHGLWWTPAARLPAGVRPSFPSGAWNLGVAHGAPGVVGLLARASAMGVTAAGLLAGRAVDWLLAQQLPAELGSGFPAFVAPDPHLDHGRSRLAWCYGDAGIAGVLLPAARQAGVADWEPAAVRIAERAAAYPLAQSGVVDAALCHGSAGLAHIYNRLYQATGSPTLRAAAERWLQHVVDAWCAERGSGLLGGAAGVGLVLLAASTPLEPGWDRLFLLS